MITNIRNMLKDYRRFILDKEKEPGITDSVKYQNLMWKR